MRRRRMGALPLDEHPALNPLTAKNHGAVVEEIKGLIRVHKDGHVDRLPAMPEVPSTWTPEPDVASRDVVINQQTGVWARFYVPKRPGGQQQQLPLLVYFHGGGFCVASSAWSCYHEFLTRLASRAGCLIMSVNYRLAPENRLPAAYDDGLAAVKWVRQQAARGGPDESGWWRGQCNLSRLFLAGDSAGATIAHHVAAQLGSSAAVPEPTGLRGVILIQPFFGGEERTASERNLAQPPRSALSLETSDCYWRLALPAGSSRDHRWCNPLARGAPRLDDLRLPPALVCVSEMDILRDRSLEFCRAMRKAGKSVEHAVYTGVGHAFQVLHNSQVAQARTHEMLTHIKNFINNT